MNARTLIVGMDLGNDFVQISSFNHKTYEPESISLSSNKTQYLIPTMIGVKKSTKEWVIGEEANRIALVGTGIKVNHLLDKVKNKEDVILYETAFSPIVLLEKFLRIVLQEFKVYYPMNSILQLVVSIAELDYVIVEGIYQGLENIGIGKERIIIQSHIKSFQYYTLYQKKEIWLNDVALFDFNEKGFVYSQLSINRRTKPFVVSTIKKDFSETLSYEMVKEGTDYERLQFVFENIAKSVLHKQIISTIFVTGRGFEQDWVDPVLKELCVGKRVFKGQNLFNKGACYTAREVSTEKKLEDYIFLGEDSLYADITIEGYHNAQLSEVVLVKAGTSWREIKEKFDIILDETKEIDIIVKNRMKQERKKYRLSLDQFPNRPRRMTRIEVSFRFESQTKGYIFIKDKGFGQFYPPTDHMVQQEILL